MPTAAEIAASKEAQRQESANRQPLTDAGIRESDPLQSPLNDRSEPSDIVADLGDDDAGRSQRQERPKPIFMSPSDEARANIAKRFKRDDEGRVPFNGDPNDPEMLYGKHGRLPEQQQEDPIDHEDPPPQQLQQQPSEKKFTIKVRGQTLELSEAELLERASKVEAADSYLKDSRDLLEQARQIRNRERDPADPHRPEDRTNTQDDVSDTAAQGDPQHPEDELEGALDEVRYGSDSKEAAAKLRRVINKEADKAADDRQIKRLIGNDNTKSTKAMKAFIDANPDIANDEDSSRFMAMKIYDIQREELIQAGIDEAKLPKDNTALANWHQFQRVHGSPVSSQEEMLEKAKQKLVSWRGGSSQQRTEQRKPAAPRVEVNVDRNARRANVPNQPTRTMVPPAQRQQQDPAQPRDRSSVIAGMRKGRGQLVG